MSVGLGPRIPVAEFSENKTMGMGLDLELSYTDISFLPVFLFARAGYQHFPGKQSYYKISEFSSISTNLYSLSPGVRLYLEPISDKMVLLLPVLEVFHEPFGPKCGLEWVSRLDFKDGDTFIVDFAERPDQKLPVVGGNNSGTGDVMIGTGIGKLFFLVREHFLDMKVDQAVL